MNAMPSGEGWVLLIITAGGIVGLAVWIVAAIVRKQRRKRLMKAPFPPAWLEILKKTLPPYELLPAELRERLHGYINVFLHEKSFEGCGSLELNDEIRVTIAAQACMLLIGRKSKCYPKLRTVLVYPHTYVAGGKGVFGGRMEQRSARLGESWQTGVVVLAWDSVRGGAKNFDDGHNVTFHEFAHQLDQEDGDADGAPVLDRLSCYGSWARVLSAEYKGLRKKKRKGKRHVMDRYGATNPAEFFAVATETFFEKPRQLSRKHPELYDEMRSYYHLEPSDWS